MQIFPLTADQVGFVMSKLPEALRGFRGGLLFDGTNLRVPDEHVALVEAINLADMPTEAAANAIMQAKKAVLSEIDRLAMQITSTYTATEEKGWIAMLAEAQAYAVSGDPADAPGLELDAAIRGDTIADRAAAVVGAAQINGLMPSMASGMRARGEQMIDATGGDPQQIEAAMAKLVAKVDSILSAAAQADRNQIIALATTGWDV